MRPTEERGQRRKTSKTGLATRLLLTAVIAYHPGMDDPGMWAPGLLATLLNIPPTSTADRSVGFSQVGLRHSLLSPDGPHRWCGRYSPKAVKHNGCSLAATVICW